MQLRNGSKALTFGEIEPVNLNNPSLAAFVRTGDEPVLVIHNVSDAAVEVNLTGDQSQYAKLVFKEKNTSLKSKTLSIAPYSSVLLQK